MLPKIGILDICGREYQKYEKPLDLQHSLKLDSGPLRGVVVVVSVMSGWFLGAESECSRSILFVIIVLGVLANAAHFPC